MRSRPARRPPRPCPSRRPRHHVREHGTAPRLDVRLSLGGPVTRSPSADAEPGHRLDVELSLSSGPGRSPSEGTEPAPRLDAGLSLGELSLLGLVTAGLVPFTLARKTGTAPEAALDARSDQASVHMNAHRGRIAGFRLAGRGSLGEVGTWSDALAPDGSRAGALLFDEFLVAVPGATQRLVATVAADRRLTQGGADRPPPDRGPGGREGEVWLLTGHPASPAVADLLTGTGGPAPDAGSAATVLVEIAQTLLAVHAAGLAHGSLQPGNVVIGDGRRDVAGRAWPDRRAARPYTGARAGHRGVGLARPGLAASWAGASPAAAELIERAATTSTTYGLAAARDLLLAEREHCPAGSPDATGWWSTLLGGGTTRGPRTWARPRTATATRATSSRCCAFLHPSWPRPFLLPCLRRRPRPMPVSAWETDEPEVRFGPGVPAETTAAQIWRAGRQENTATSRSGGRRNAPRQAAPPYGTLLGGPRADDRGRACWSGCSWRHGRRWRWRRWT